MNKTVHDTTHACKKQVPMITLSFLLLFAVKGGAEVVYENDFSTRTSKEPIPALGVWQTAQPYPATSSYLCSYSNGTSHDHSLLQTYFSSDAKESGYGRPSVDGWFIPYFGAYKLIPYYWYPKTGSLSKNPVFTWAYGSTTKQAGAIVHSLHNEFTNGMFRMQVDMKASVIWNADHCRVFVFPVYRKYMDILVWDAKTHETLNDVSPGRVGIRGDAGNNITGEALKITYPIWSNESSGNGTRFGSSSNVQGSFSDDGSNGKTNYWFRYIVTYDLDNNTFGADLYRFSKAKGHPSFDTEPSDTGPWQSISDKAARTSLSAATGGIAGFAIAANGNFNGTAVSTAESKPFVDNIRLSWKAPGATDFEVFYENDFTTRRYKTLCPPPPAATTCAYVQSVLAENVVDTFTGYTSGKTSEYKVAPQMGGDRTVAQPIGLDGWRRLPQSAGTYNGRVGVIAYGGDATYDAGGTGGKMLTFGNQDHVALLTQPLGSSFSSGTVRIVADARLPKGTASQFANSRDHRRAAIGLGSASLYDANRAQLLDNLACGFGYHRLAPQYECGHRPYYIVAGGSDGNASLSYPSSYTEPTGNEWVRIEVSANLDTKKYSVTATPLGAASVTADDAATASSIFSESSLDFAANVSDIGTFYLLGYGYGADATASYINLRVCWDNIRVYHNSDLIYENDFTTRTRTLTGAMRETGELAAQQYNLDGGQDHWVRRDYTGADSFNTRAWVRDDNGNKFVALGRATEGSGKILVGNTLGCSVRKDFRFEVDIRPPSQWSAKNGYATISLGDSQMAQTEAPESVYGAHRLVTFGFNGASTANDAECPYYFAGCKAQVGGTELDAEIDPTHWYRFRLKVNTQQGSYDVELRDMGTAHPTAETAGGTVVAEAKSVSFANALSADEGVSTIHIEGDGLAGSYGSLGVDPAHVLIDNIRMSDIPGMIVICF